ncbi:lectin-like domain-containing protein [Schleiferilactobacillus shenzhenensis]|nr:hypothetical protein [Schleiferilactobacillus shenzhenensis]
MYRTLIRRRVLAVLLLIFCLIWVGRQTHRVQADDPPVHKDGTIYTTPADTQDFFSAYGQATVARDLQGNWSTVTLTDTYNQASAVTLNNRVDLTKDFSLKYAIMFGQGTQSAITGKQVADGLAFGIYPAQLGAVGMFGGNMGLATLPHVLGVKFDPYMNDSSNQVYGTTAHDLAATLGLDDDPYDPTTQTADYAAYFRDKNGEGKVFGTLDADVAVDGASGGNKMPFGALLEGSDAGWLKILKSGDTSSYYGGTVASNPTKMDPSEFWDGNWHGITANYRVSGDTGTITFDVYQAQRNGQFYEGFDGTDANGNPTTGETPAYSWSMTVNIPQMLKSTNNAPYFALNVSASTGGSMAVQQVRAFYADYTPEPGAFTSRFVDQNGNSIKDALNQGNFQSEGKTFSSAIPYTIDSKNGSFKDTDVSYIYDYTTYEKYNKPQDNDIYKLTATSTNPATQPDNGALVQPSAQQDLTYYGTYDVPYQRIINHYRRVATRPTIKWTLGDGANTTDDTTTVTKPGSTTLTTQKGRSLTYAYTVKAPATGPNPWTGVHLNLTVPAGFNVTSTAAELDSDVPATDKHGTEFKKCSDAAVTTTANADHSTTLAITKTAAGNALDLYSTPKDEAMGQYYANELTVTVTLTPFIAGIDSAISADLSDTYTRSYTQPGDADAAKLTHYYTDYPLTVTSPVQVPGDAVSDTDTIPMPDRSNETHVFTTNDQLHMPVSGLTLTSNGMSYWPITDASDTTVRLTAADITPSVTGTAALPVAQFSLTASGIAKLKANDRVKAAFLFTGTAAGVSYNWVVDYTLYEPLSTWMPDAGLRQLVTTAFNDETVTIDSSFTADPVTYTNTVPGGGTISANDGAANVLQKSMMPALQGLSNLTGTSITNGHPHTTQGSTGWNIRHAATGLEYATKLQGMAIYGEKLLKDTDQSTADQNFRSFMGHVQSATLVTLDLSGYDRTSDLFSKETTAATLTDYPQLANLNLVADQLTGSDVQAAYDDNGKTYQDVAAFLQKNHSHLSQINLSSYAEPALNTNAKNVNDLESVATLTASDHALTINQQDMLIGTTLPVITLAPNTAGNGLNMVIQDLHHALTHFSIDGAGSVLPIDPSTQPVTFQLFDQATTTTSSSNADLTSLVADAHLANGVYTFPYADYLKLTKQANDTLYARLSTDLVNGAVTTHFSLWIPFTTATNSHQLIVTSPNLSFGKRILTAGSHDYLNDDHDDTTGTDDGTGSVPVTITTVRGTPANSDRVSISASAFTGADATQVTSMSLLYTDQNRTAPLDYTVLADGSAGTPQTWNYTGAETVHTNTYTVRLHVPSTAGISPQKYNATITYTDDFDTTIGG